MEVSVMGRVQSATPVVAMPEVFFPTRLAPIARGSKIVSFPPPGRNGLGRMIRLKSSAKPVRIRSKTVAGEIEVEERSSTNTTLRQRVFCEKNDVQVIRRPQFFVGLPLDVISDNNTLNHGKAIAAGLKALKLLGADGVDIPLWWGLAEKESMGKYEWSGYLELVQMIRDVGLHIRISMNFHASTAPAIPLPSWVAHIGDAEPDIYFTDKEGRRHRECLSLSVDNLPVLGGKTPIQVYSDFFRSFQAAFSEFIGSTITDILIGLGPGGELRYPSLSSARKQEVAGVGEFQCYDKHMLSNLKQHAVEIGHNFWGLSGPHDAPQYDESPNTGNFFKEEGGSWESDYGNFFLTWYSDQLISHGDRLLSAASEVFGNSAVTLSGKVPLMHSWYKTRSHPSELTAGYYNTDRRDGYDSVAKMFVKNSCTMVLPGMDLSDEIHPQAYGSSPESMLSQILGTCKKHGVRLSGENSSWSMNTNGFNKIKENIFDGRSQHNNLIDSFTYQRMGAYFFSPDHWPQFTEFIRSIDRAGMHSDDLPTEEIETISLRKDAVSDNSREMHAV